MATVEPVVVVVFAGERFELREAGEVGQPVGEGARLRARVWPLEAWGVIGRSSESRRGGATRLWRYTQPTPLLALPASPAPSSPSSCHSSGRCGGRARRRVEGRAWRRRGTARAAGSGSSCRSLPPLHPHLLWRCALLRRSASISVGNHVVVSFFMSSRSSPKSPPPRRSAPAPALASVRPRPLTRAPWCLP
jgi:hypothetical protein